MQIRSVSLARDADAIVALIRGSATGPSGAASSI